MDFDNEKLKNVTMEELVAAYNELIDSRNRVFSIVSHDLRSPFSGLLGLSEMMADNLSSFSSSEFHEYIVSMRDSLKNTYLLLENLFEWGRIERKQYDKTIESIPLKIITDEIITVLSDQISKKEIEVFHMFDEDRIITANSGMIEYILKNLVSNAIKYSYRGGRIEIGFSDTAENAAISVRDYGVGIPSEKLDKLFSMKTGWRALGTEDETGTGLGLLVSCRYAEAFGVGLEVESAPLKGSTFSIILPPPRA